MNHMTILKGMNKKALAGYTMPKGLGDALKPAPAAMKINKPQQTVGNQMMDQAAAAEGVSTAPSSQDPVSALTTSLDKITAVAKGLVPKAAPATTPTAQPDLNPAQVAQQQNHTVAQPGNPKLASVSKGKLLLYGMLKGMNKSAGMMSPSMEVVKQRILTGRKVADKYKRMSNVNTKTTIPTVGTLSEAMDQYIKNVTNPYVTRGDYRSYLEKARNATTAEERDGWLNKLNLLPPGGYANQYAPNKPSRQLRMNK